MIRFKTAGIISMAMLIVAAFMYAFNVLIEPPIGSRSHMLLIGDGTGEYWQQTLAGAQDAARELGVDLDVIATSDDLVDQQITSARRTNPADYDGVAISPADPESQIRLPSRTKLVTFDRDGYTSQRLCHIGFAQETAGALVARLVGDQLSRPGKVALIATTFADDAQNSNVAERLVGFKEQWGACGQNPAMPCHLIQVALHAKNLERPSADFSTTLADPELSFIVALDRRAAEAALDGLATRSAPRRVPIIAFDPDRTIFDAIDDGRLCAAVFDDPYRSGFTAIQRLGAYCGEDEDSLPVPGYGSYFLISEVVRKENLAAIRRRIDHNRGGSNASSRPMPANHKRMIPIQEITQAG